MQKYFIESSDFEQRKITTDDAFHICKVMRFKKGEEVLVGVDSKTFLVSLDNITEKSVSFNLIKEIEKNNELPVNVTIIQGYPKGDKFEEVIKHGVELGAYEFIPCLMKRSQFNVDEKRKDGKIIRFNKISKEAAEQSFRAYPPKVLPFMNLKQIDLESFDLVVLCYEEDAKNGELENYKTAIKKLEKGKKVAIIVGPEGGISVEELDYLSQKNNVVVAALGPRILRTETVVFYALSTISYEMELKECIK